MSQNSGPFLGCRILEWTQEDGTLAARSVRGLCAFLGQSVWVVTSDTNSKIFLAEILKDKCPMSYDLRIMDVYVRETFTYQSISGE